MSIADIARDQMRAALTGVKSHCDVSEWLDEGGKPVRVYWLPPTGAQQIKIDAFNTDTERQAMTVKLRALDENGNRIFKDTPIESLLNDFDNDVLRSIAYLIVTNFGQDVPKLIDEKIEDAAKE